MTGADTCEALPTIVKASGWPLPYVVTSYGPSDGFQMPATSWGAPVEERSEVKKQAYLRCAAAFEADHCNATGVQPCSLGHVALRWAPQQHITPTWYSVFNPLDFATYSSVFAEASALPSARP